MSGLLEPLWRVLREQPDARHPVEGWRRELGEGYALVAAWLKITRDTAGTWPCGIPGATGCSRRIVEHGHDDLVAVCMHEPPRCDKVAVPRSALALRRLDLVALARLLLDTSGVPKARVRAARRWVGVGPSQLGTMEVVLALTREPSTLGLLEIADHLREAHPQAHVVLLAPVAEALPVAEARAFDRQRAEVLPLGEVFVVRDRAVVADLSDWVLRHREDLQGFDPLPMIGHRYALILDPLHERCALRGRWIDLRRARLPRRFLEGLASQAGRLVTRDELFDEVWPDKHPSDSEAWEVNLRTHKSKLDKLLGDEGRELVETVPGSALDGGYRLALEPDQVLWWTRSRA